MGHAKIYGQPTCAQIWRKYAPSTQESIKQYYRVLGLEDHEVNKTTSKEAHTLRCYRLLDRVSETLGSPKVGKVHGMGRVGSSVSDI